jgi:S-formylglutathione hydrolase
MIAKPLLALIAFALALGAPTLTNAAAPDATRYQRVVVHADSLAGNLSGDSPDRHVSVWLPPGYAKNKQRRYPVLYLLHGFTDSDAKWFGLEGQHFVNTPAAVDAAFAKNVPEMIVVMPDGLNVYGGSFYSNSVTVGDWETFVTRELVRYVDTHYRTLAQPESRGLAGHSMGGYGTLRLGMKVPGVFAALYAMSPCCVGATLSPNAGMFTGASTVRTREEIAQKDFITKAMLATAAAWSPNPKKPPLYLDLPVADGKVVPDVLMQQISNSPLAMLAQNVPALKSYRALAIDAGDKDGQITSDLKLLHAKLEEYSIAHSYEIYDGDHLNRISDRLTTKVLPFFGEHLSVKKASR